MLQTEDGVMRRNRKHFQDVPEDMNRSKFASMKTPCPENQSLPLTTSVQQSPSVSVPSNNIKPSEPEPKLDITSSPKKYTSRERLICPPPRYQ